MSAETIARVSGILMVKVVPRPGTDLTSIVPPISSMLARTTSMPMPRPDTLVTLSAVENPGAKMNFCTCASVSVVDLGLGSEAERDGLGPDARDVETASVVGDLDDDVTALVTGGQADGATLVLAGSEALRRRLEPVVGRVADHVGERIANELEHLAVELGVGPVHLELDRLAEFGGQVAHDPRQLLPGAADRLHAGLQHALLQLRGHIREPLQRSP